MPERDNRMPHTQNFGIWSYSVWHGAITSSYQHRAAPGVAMTSNGAILLFSHSPSVIAFSSVKPSQAMRTADREPAGGEIPVELVCRQPFGDFPKQRLGVSRTNKVAFL